MVPRKIVRRRCVEARCFKRRVKATVLSVAFPSSALRVKPAHLVVDVWMLKVCPCRGCLRAAI